LRSSFSHGAQQAGHRFVQEVDGRPNSRRNGDTRVRRGTVGRKIKLPGGLHLICETQSFPLCPVLCLAENFLVTHQAGENASKFCFILIHFALILFTSTVQGFPGQVHTRATKSHAFRTSKTRSVLHGDAGVSRKKAAVTRQVHRASVALNLRGKAKAVLCRKRSHRIPCADKRRARASL
jgi:hypothetical protein